MRKKSSRVCEDSSEVRENQVQARFSWWLYNRNLVIFDISSVLMRLQTKWAIKVFLRQPPNLCLSQMIIISMTRCGVIDSQKTRAIAVFSSVNYLSPKWLSLSKTRPFKLNLFLYQKIAHLVRFAFLFFNLFELKRRKMRTFSISARTSGWASSDTTSLITKFNSLCFLEPFLCADLFTVNFLLQIFFTFHSKFSLQLLFLSSL